MKKKMLFFHHCGTIGGASISGLCFLDSVPKDRYDITVYTVSDPDQVVQKYRHSGYRVVEGGSHPASFSHCVGGKMFALSPGAIRNYLSVKRSRKVVDKVIAEEKPDVVVVNSMTLFWVGKIAKAYGAETICFFRETYIHGLFGVRTGMIKRHLSRYFDKIAFISNYELVRSKKVACDKRTIYNMVPQDNYDRYTKSQAREMLGLDKDSFFVLFVGGLSPLKGTRVLLKAFSRIHDSNIKLLFVGRTLQQIEEAAAARSFKQKIKHPFSGNYAKSCLKWIRKNQDQIVFFPSQSDISPFYCGADVLVFPMTQPHQARPLFEAGYAKIPVIVTDFENIQELVDADSGYLFENKNDTQLADLICKIKNKQTDIQQRVERNYQNTVARHAPVVYRKQIEELLD